MKKSIEKISKFANLIISYINLLIFFSIRMCWSGISKTLKYEDSYSNVILFLPVAIFFILILLFILNIIFYKKGKDKYIYSYIMNGVNFVFLIANIVIIALGAIDYITYALPYFFEYVLITILLIVAYFIIYIYPKSHIKNNNIFKGVSFWLILTITLGLIVNFTFNYISYEPVVYIVEDKYQIVFSSNTESIAYVKINDQYYYDNYNGSNRSYTKVHKIEVPMEELDVAKEYTIGTQKLTYRGPFGGFKGREIKETYAFKPIDTNDGLNYYAMSDVHMGLKCSVQASDFNKDKELLILAGDIVSMVEREEDAQYANKVAFEMTKGAIPVIYARGNHEIKGKYSEYLHNYVGAKNEDFFYRFTFGNTIGYVLDIGEDHDDDYWEYYETAYFEEYRNKQLEFLNQELSNKEYLNYEYRMVVCHIPIPFVNNRHNHAEFKKELTDVLNKLNVNMVISGHQHDLLIFDPGEINPYESLTYNKDFDGKGKSTKAYLTDFNFPSFTISKRGYTQNDDSKLTKKVSQIGLTVKVDFINKVQICQFNNSKHELVNVVNPYKSIDYKDTITFSLTNNKRV